MATTTLRCTSCGRQFPPGRVPPDEQCPYCEQALQRPGRLEALFDRLFGGSPRALSDAERLHFRMIEAIWSDQGRAHEYYALIRPKRTSYSSFVRQVTYLHLRGLNEGWIDLVLPRAPLGENPSYDVFYRDPERFVAELRTLYPDADWQSDEQ